jgi:hypothetical protein
MTTTKTTEKTSARRPEPSAEEVQAAYQCHTLAQILYGRIAATHPWLLEAPRAPSWPMGAIPVPPWMRPRPCFPV